MHISHIVLKNWKSYESAEFKFPKPTADQNIALIGAPNGYGKTSLLEAIILALFGSFGFHYLPRRQDKESDSATSYKEFLERALYKRTSKQGLPSCSVQLVFANDNGDKYDIQRVWHFDENRLLRVNDEDIFIFWEFGGSRNGVGRRGLPHDERMRICQNYITDKILWHAISRFFLFDGEQVGEMANHDKSLQVRSGIESLFGINVLRQLGNDLRDYAEDRGRATRGVSENKLNKLSKELDALISKHESINNHHREIVKPKLHTLKDERKSLNRELKNFGVDSQGSFDEKLERISQLTREIDNGESKVDINMKDFALALSGPALRHTLNERMDSENARSEWLGLQKQVEANIDKFIGAVKFSIKNIVPALREKQSGAVLSIARKELENLLHPPRGASEYRHSYLLTDAERSKVIDRLGELDSLGASAITSVLDQLAKKREERQSLRNELEKTKGLEKVIKSKIARLTELSNQIESLSREEVDITRDMKNLDDQIKQKKALHKQQSDKLDFAKRPQRLTNRARTAIRVIEEITKRAVPSQTDAIAQAMTDAYKQISHKEGFLDRIVIDDECNVMMLDADGDDLRKYDIAEGEKQIFTQSLFSAVISVSGHHFPMVIDTPFARLDDLHRKNLLMHLAKRGHQVILLSTDTEVVGEYLDIIEPHVQKKYLLNFKKYDDGTSGGHSSVTEGYFSRKEAK